MKKKAKESSFLKNFISLGIGTMIYMVIGVIGTPIITRLVDPADYGAMSMFTVYGSIGLMVCGLGMDQTLVRYFYRDESIDYKRRLLRECCAIPGIAAVVLGVLYVIGIMFTNKIGITNQSLAEVLALEIYVLVLLLQRFAILVLRLRYHTDQYSMVNIIQKLSYIVITICMVLKLKNHYYFILIFANIMSTLLAASVAIIIEKEIWNFKKLDHALAQPRKELLRFGVPIMFSSGITMVFNALDKLFVNHYCTLSDVGVYASAMNLMAVFSIVNTSFNALWMPTAVDHFEKNPEDQEFYRKGNAFISMLMVTFGAGVILCKDLFVLLLGRKYQEAAIIVPFLMFEPIMYTISETTATGIVVQKKSKYQVIVASVACLTNLIGNWILTPIMGPKGAALSTGISYVVFFAIRTYLANKVFHVEYLLKRFAVVIIALWMFAFYGSAHYFSVIQIGMFFGIIVIMLVAYKKYVRDGITYARNLIKRMIGK